jgi:hypothetical protein
MLIEALQTALAADAGMQSFLGTPTSRSDQTTGIFPVQAIDQPTLPFLVLSQVSGEPLETSMRGTGRLTSERWRFSFCGSTYKQAKKFAKYGRAFVISIIGEQPAGSCDIQGAWIKLEADDAESLGKGTMWQSHIDVQFNYVDGDN